MVRQVGGAGPDVFRQMDDSVDSPSKRHALLVPIGLALVIGSVAGGALLIETAQQTAQHQIEARFELRVALSSQFIASYVRLSTGSGPTPSSTTPPRPNPRRPLPETRGDVGAGQRRYLLEIRSVPLVVCEIAPDVPDTVNTNVPRGLAAVVIVRTEALFPVSEVGEKVPVDPDGSPLTESATVPENPFKEPSAIVYLT